MGDFEWCALCSISGPPVRRNTETEDRADVGFFRSSPFRP